MQHECKITVLETKCFPEYQEKYLADPKWGRVRSMDFFVQIIANLVQLTYNEGRK